jgi:hypothetical protein
MTAESAVFKFGPLIWQRVFSADGTDSAGDDAINKINAIRVASPCTGRDSRVPGSVAEQPSNFSGKRVIILPGDRSKCGQHTYTLRRASIVRAKRAFIMEM